MVRSTLFSEEEVLKRIIVDPEDDCWVWIGSRFQQSGYGRIKMNGRSFVAHRFSYEIFFGQIPDGLALDHLCRRRECVNPNHMEPVTYRVNVLRGDTVTAKNAVKTHCINGHPLSGDNLFLRKKPNRVHPSRHCRICHRAAGKRSRSRPEWKELHAKYERERKGRKKMKKQYRQGDILIERISDELKAPTDMPLVKREANGGVVLAYGETTFHKHQVISEHAVLYGEVDPANPSDLHRDLLLLIDEKVSLTHEEHAPIDLEPGTYRVVRQREYVAGKLVYVAD